MRNAGSWKDQPQAIVFDTRLSNTASTPITSSHYPGSQLQSCYNRNYLIQTILQREFVRLVELGDYLEEIPSSVPVQVGKRKRTFEDFETILKELTLVTFTSRLRIRVEASAMEEIAKLVSTAALVLVQLAQR